MTASLAPGVPIGESALLFTLIQIYQRLGVGWKRVSTGVKWLVHLPFSVYIGWISVALIANTAAYLISISWDGFGISQVSWTILTILVATYLGQSMISKRNDIAYGLVIIWAFTGIILRHQEQEFNLVLAAGIGIALIGLMVITSVFRSLKS